jgi:hypothetical protein
LNSEQRDVSKAVKMETRSHMMIPDLQIREGVPLAHLDWIGEYIVDRKPNVVVQIGDAFDMACLNRHRKARELEGARYERDITIPKEGMARIRQPARRARLKTEFHQLGGNHEQMIQDAIDLDPKLEGTISMDDVKCPGWIWHDFLEPVDLDGVVYSHYFYHPMNGKPLAGTIENRLQKLGHSFTMGHQQTLTMGMRYVKGRSQHGLVAGACYLHDENYKGPQGNAHWRGVVMKHQVEEGSYDIMPVSLDFLCRKYEGMRLAEFLAKGGK